MWTQSIIASEIIYFIFYKVIINGQIIIKYQIFYLLNE